MTCIDPFGYDKNDLNLDHFTHNIIRNELHAITSAPPPNPDHWVFAPENDMLFIPHNVSTYLGGMTDVERVTPDEWTKRGFGRMQEALAMV